MNEHAGPACALSFLIVGVFAFLLHDNRQTPSPRQPYATSSSARPQSRPADASLPDPSGKPTSGREPASSQEKTSAPAVADKSVRAQTEGASEAASRNAPALSPEARPRSLSPEPLKPPAPATSRTAFTVVREGESLTDVAARVYGSKDATEPLWRANLDQVSKIDTPLTRGTLLRTP
jgi:hypothetical protein